MNLPKFTADDFKGVDPYDIIRRVNDRLHEFEKSCVRVYRHQNEDSGWSQNVPAGWPSHQALIFGITEIDQAVTKDELISALRREPELIPQWAEDLADRIEKFGVR